jgi:leucyl-tRNA synthetase
VEWNEEAVNGAYRFLGRIWRLPERIAEAPPAAAGDAALERERHRAIKRVGEDMERFKFNTAVAALMELVNALSRALEDGSASRGCCERTFDTLLQLAHPAAPHLTEELWERRGQAGGLLTSRWPEYDEAQLAEARVTLVVQVDGKLRDRIEVDREAGRGEIEALALASERVRAHLEGGEIERVVVVPGRLVNLVTRRPS